MGQRVQPSTPRTAARGPHHLRPTTTPSQAIVTTTSRRRRIGDGPLPQMELPRARQPVERDGDDCKRLKAPSAAKGTVEQMQT
jgi:hypothetical protein